MTNIFVDDALTHCTSLLGNNGRKNIIILDFIVKLVSTSLYLGVPYTILIIPTKVPLTGIYGDALTRIKLTSVNDVQCKGRMILLHSTRTVQKDKQI